MRFFLGLCLAIAASSYSPAACAPAASISLHHLIDRDGVAIAWWSAGTFRRSDPPVLFIHGGPGEGSQVFRATVMPLIARSARVMAFDMRGAGASQMPADKALYSGKAVLTDIDAVLDAAHAKRAVLVAHSAGTIWALQYAQEHPDRVAGLVLSGAVPDLPAAVDRLCERLERERPENFDRAVKAAPPGQRCNPFKAFATEKQQQAWFSANMFPNKQTQDLVKKLDDAVHRDESGAHSILRDQMNFHVEHPERLTMPVLFIDGAKDDQTDERSQQALASRVRDGRYVAYAHAGHFPFVDEPIRYARDVLAFIRHQKRS